MAETIFTRALRQATDMHGSTQALASELRVPENTLQRWMEGRARMPLQAFLRTVEVLTAHERHSPAAPAPAGLAEQVTFSVDGVFARCGECDGTEFLSAVPRDALRMTSALECRSCDAPATYGVLAGALATLAITHSRRGRLTR